MLNQSRKNTQPQWFPRCYK